MVVEDSRLDVVGGSCRAAVLRMLQGIWGHATVRAPCHLFAPTDPKVASRFKAKDTTTRGTGILFHRQQEAYHMHHPLFRCAQEWCDRLEEPAQEESLSMKASVDGIPSRPLAAHGHASCEAGQLQLPALSTQAGSTHREEHLVKNNSSQGNLPALPEDMHPQAEAASSTSIRMTGSEELLELEPLAQSRFSQEGSAAAPNKHTFVCCMWLAGKCWKKGEHSLGKRLYLHEDVPGMACAFGNSCRYLHYKSRATAPSRDSEGGSSSVQVLNGQSSSDTGHECPHPLVLQVGMTVFVKGPKFECGEVKEISHDLHRAAAPIKVCYGVLSQNTAWFTVDSLQVPDYSSLSRGMRVNVLCEDVSFLCEIMQISDEVSRAHAPVQVSYNGYASTDDEWVGADRLRSKFLRFVEPHFPSQLLEPRLSSESRGSTDDSVAASRENTFVCCMWLAGKCWKKGEHSLGKRLYLHEDVPGMACAFGNSCRYLHYKSRATTPSRDSEGGSSSVQVLNGQSSSDTGHECPHPLVLQVGMTVFVKGPKFECGEVKEISHDLHRAAAPIKVCYGVLSQNTAWFTVDSLQVPDYSSLSRGMRVNVLCEDVSFLCEIMQISDEVSRAHAPVQVSYNGYASTDDEWVGADRLRSKFLRFVEPHFPSQLLEPRLSSESRGSTDDSVAASRENTFVCCMWLAGKCWKKGEHSLGKRLYLHEDVPGIPCGFGDRCTYLHYQTRAVRNGDAKGGSSSVQVLNGQSSSDTGHECPHPLVLQVGMMVSFSAGTKYECAKVIEISHECCRAAAPIKVCYGVLSQKTAWFAVDRLQVPDYYSSLSPGMRVNVVCHDISYVCKIMEISREVSRASAPVRVSYQGHTSADDEWVGADRLRAKALKYVQPQFPAKLQVQAQPAVQSRGSEQCDFTLSRKNVLSSDTSMDACKLPSNAYPAHLGHTQTTHQVYSSAEKAVAPNPEPRGPLPWHAAEVETDEDAIILDRAIDAVSKALKQEGLHDPWQRLLEQALCPIAASSLVGCVLAHYGWTGDRFSPAPELQKLYNHLAKTRSDLFEDGYSCEGVDNDSDTELLAEASEVFLEVENDAASSCAMQADSLDEMMDRQQNTINKLTGTLICGTFRCVAASSEGKLKHCGEVIVERGPAPLLGCKVRIPAGKSRGNAWDCDCCYVRILVAAVSVL